MKLLEKANRESRIGEKSVSPRTEKMRPTMGFKLPVEWDRGR